MDTKNEMILSNPEGKEADRTGDLTEKRYRFGGNTGWQIKEQRRSRHQKKVERY